MKKTISLFLSVLFVFIFIFQINIVAAGPVSGDEINVIHKAVSVSPRILSLNKGQAYKLTVTLDPVVIGDEVNWTSSNSSVVSVTSYGLVVAKSAGTAVITVSSDSPMVQGYTYSDTCTITVTSNSIVENGTYFIQTAQRNNNDELLDAFIEIENQSTSNGAAMQAGVLSGDDYKKWVITLGTDGYYTVESEYSSKYMGVTNSSATAGATITQNGTIASGSKWAIMTTSSGNYAFVPASSTSSLVVLNLPGSTSGCDLNTAYYSNNSDYKDEWVLNRMLPTNGYELDYSPSSWSNCIGNCCNCYAYAINNQIYPGTNLLYFMQQMGWYKGPSYEFSSLSLSNIFTAVSFDFEEYNSNFNTSLVFQSIGRYDTCPVGTYKVALVVSDDDYHWYRQDSDGLWSHKPGITPVTRLDENQHYIIDPQIADRGSYTSFLGYFAVSPWNNCYSYSGTVYCYVVIIDENQNKQGYIMLYDDLMNLINSLQSSMVILPDGTIQISGIDDLALLNISLFSETR